MDIRICSKFQKSLKSLAYWFLFVDMIERLVSMSEALPATSTISEFRRHMGFIRVTKHKRRQHSPWRQDFKFVVLMAAPLVIACGLSAMPNDYQ